MFKAFILIISMLPFAIFANTTVIKNIQGYSLDDNQLVQFHALAFENDKIIAIYQQGHQPPTGSNINVIDGKGKTLIPGLIDAHGHVLSYGLSLLTADLTNSHSEQDAVNKTLAYAKHNNATTWVLGRGWNQSQWQNKRFPTVSSLDKVFPDQPVWLKRVDGHAGWANSKALALAGINKDTPSPNGGEIIRDQQGKPTGVLIDNAMALIDNSIAPLSLQQSKDVLIKAMKSLASMGLTSVHDAGIDIDNINAYKSLAKEKAMPIRINAMLYLPSKNWQQVLKQGKFRSQDDMFTLNSVKIQADGALGSRGAALIEDYSDHPGHKGLLLSTQQQLNNFIEKSIKHGFQVNTHAIGDNANKIVLDTYQRFIKTPADKALRHRVEHAQILRLQDIPRFAELGVIASMQATHATSDKNMAENRIGPKRILGAYAWRKLLNAKAIIAAGSDFPVESPNPFYGLHAAVTRQDHHNSPENGWYANEKMTLIEAFKSFTIDAAYSGHQENIMGSLAKGKKADFILLNDNIFTMAEQNLWQVTVQQTWVNGKLIYQQKQ